MKTAREVLYDNLSERQAGIISEDQYMEEWISDAMKEYAKQVAKQALKDAVEACDETEDNRGEHQKYILSIEIKLP